MVQDLWTLLLAFLGQFIVPDGGALVALIPIGIAAIVFLTTAWIVSATRPPVRPAAASTRCLPRARPACA